MARRFDNVPGYSKDYMLNIQHIPRYSKQKVAYCAADVKLSYLHYEAS